MVCFEPEGPQESTEELGNRLPTGLVWVLPVIRDQLRNRELILNNGVVIHLQGFSYLMRLEAECFALSLRDLRN
ncbi:hypothetical protein AI2601V1_5477 (plasmid) [Klebsiella pneumoniae]|nr:hypothetical protein CTI55_26830 [Klebsiella pneumoniae]ATR07646.1 hypothetical protein CTI56_28210 [Klebsiella pneumoniae]ATR18755.1 hypothetical protein CTI58_28110 [Klebsiella pneumoniae]CAE6083699.1 hypothetical protein AI2591V1_5474 [Klebsiella pneumoniae]CAE6201439.1 hypothetical protein AI2601V1_5477 [Klebsiella pneumoniae]